jgi:hypothetical protein
MMNLPAVTLAAEGIADIAVLRRLVREVKLTPGDEHGRRGKAHLDCRVPGYNNAARFGPWLVARDLDHDAPCAGEFARRILTEPARLMRFRIVVRAVEAWLFGDKKAFCEEFRVASLHVPDDPEGIAQPKSAMLFTLSKSSSSDVRHAMVRVDRNGAIKVGSEYNTMLSAFAEGAWRLKIAAASVPSLARAHERLKELATLLRRSPR